MTEQSFLQGLEACRQCGEVFIPYSSRHVFCTSVCRLRSYKDKTANGGKDNGVMPDYKIQELMRDLPVAVRVVRAARGLTLREMADKCDVSAATISRIENDERTNLEWNTAIALLDWIASA